MDKSNSDISAKPPFFKDWKGLYWFILLFELCLIIAFILITEHYSYE